MNIAQETNEEIREDPPPPQPDPKRELSRQRSGLLPNLGQLSKARLNMLVLGTTAVGFALAGTELPAMRLFWTLVGTAMAAASAGMLNQLAEVERDSRMQRTGGRPLPAGLVSRKTVFILGVLLAYGGVSVLAIMVNWLSSGLALANVIIYVLIYTPLKARTTLNTLVGAICGAIPPMIGWAAAVGNLDGGAWLLGALLFVWQLPHFFALAMMYREDYERGGFAMLPVVDQRGEVTVQVILVTSLILVPLGLGATVLGIAGWFSAIAAVVLGCMMTAFSLHLYIKRTTVAARRVFLASLAYLPLMLGAMVIDAGPTEASSNTKAAAKAPDS